MDSCGVLLQLVCAVRRVRPETSGRQVSQVRPVIRARLASQASEVRRAIAAGVDLKATAENSARPVAREKSERRANRANGESPDRRSKHLHPPVSRHLTLALAYVAPVAPKSCYSTSPNCSFWTRISTLALLMMTIFRHDEQYSFSTVSPTGSQGRTGIPWPYGHEGQRWAAGFARSRRSARTQGLNR